MILVQLSVPRRSFALAGLFVLLALLLPLAAYPMFNSSVNLTNSSRLDLSNAATASPVTVGINVTTNLSDITGSGEYVASVTLPASFCSGNNNFAPLGTPAPNINMTWAINCTINSSYIGNVSETSNYILNITATNNTGGTNTTAASGNGPAYSISNIRIDRTVPYIGTSGVGAYALHKSDNFFSPFWQNNNISIKINATDLNTGIKNVTVAFNFTNGTGFCNGSSAIVWNTTFNSTSLLYDQWPTNQLCNITQVISDLNITTPTSAYATVSVYDNASNYNSTTINLLLHDLGRLQGPPANATGPGGINVSQCFREGAGTTNMSNITNFNSVQLIQIMQLNGSASCMAALGLSEAAPWGNAFQTMGRFAYDSVNMSTQAQAQQVMSAMGSAIQIFIAPPRSHVASRIFVNSSAISVLNTSANVTLYNLPFAATPNVLYDSGGTNDVTLTWAQDPNYNATMGTWMGNLTIGIGNFSGYNFSDSVAPSITNEYPVNLGNYSRRRINFTVNGTGSDIHSINATVYDPAGSLMNAPYYYTFNGTTNTLNCTNTTPGLDYIYCEIDTLPLPAAYGNYSLVVKALDYGGSVGNINTSTIVFMNNTPPTISAVTTINAPNHILSLFATVSDDNGVQDIRALTLGVNTTLVNCTAWYNSSGLASYSVYFNCTNRTTYNGTNTNFTINITVNDTYNNTAITANYANLTLPNYVPYISAVTITPTTANNVTNLTCTMTVSDNDSRTDSLNYTIRWYRYFAGVSNNTVWSANNPSTASAKNLSIGLYNATDVMICEAYANDSFGNSGWVNSSAMTITRVAFSNISGVTSDDCNTTHAVGAVLYADNSGNMQINLTIPTNTNISPVAGYDLGSIYISNFTATSGDLASSHAFGLNFILGPPGTTFTDNTTGAAANITVVMNYSSLSAGQKSTIETALAAGHMRVKKCSDTGTSCTSLTPISYNTALDTLAVSISSFSTLGLYDATPATPAGSGSSSASSSGTGGGSSSGSRSTSYAPSAPATTPTAPAAPTPAPATPATPTVPAPVPPATPVATGEQPSAGEPGTAGGQTGAVPTTEAVPSAPSAPSAPEPPQESGLGPLAGIIGIVVVIGAIGAGAYFLLGPKRKGL